MHERDAGAKVLESGARVVEAITDAAAAEPESIRLDVLAATTELGLDLAELRREHEALKGRMGDLEKLLRTEGRDWNGIAPANLSGMLALLMPWARTDVEARMQMAEAMDGAHHDAIRNGRAEGMQGRCAIFVTDERGRRRMVSSTYSERETHMRAQLEE